MDATFNESAHLKLFALLDWLKSSHACFPLTYSQDIAYLLISTRHPRLVSNRFAGYSAQNCVLNSNGRVEKICDSRLPQVKFLYFT